MFLACQQSKVTIKLNFYYSNLKNAVETAKIAIDSRLSIDFREIRGLFARSKFSLHESCKQHHI
jgi:hypothetical protein